MGSKHLEVTVVSGSDLPNTLFLGVGKQDPYVILRYGAQEFRTKTHNNGHQDPRFDEKFSFVVSEGESVMEFVIMNDNKRKDELMGTAKVDFVLALEKGRLQKGFPVTNNSKNFQGMLQLIFVCPEVVAEVEAAEKIEKMKLNSAMGSYHEALSNARGKYYGEVDAQMAPVEAVFKALSEEHEEELRAIKEEEEKEMGKIFEEPQKKAGELVTDAKVEWAQSTQTFLESLPETLKEQAPAAEAKFRPQLGTMVQLVQEADGRRAQELGSAKTLLETGLADLLSRYRASVLTAYERYDMSLTGATTRYKKEMEAILRAEAETKSVEEAARIAPPPIIPQPAPASLSSSGSSGASASPRSPRAATSRTPPRSPRSPRSPRMGGSTSFGFVPPPVYQAPPPPAQPVYAAPPPPVAAGVPAGYPMTQTEMAQAEAQRAQSEARQAQAAAERAARDAEMARRESQATQAALHAQIMQQRRAAAVRRGVVGGVLLSRAIRR